MLAAQTAHEALIGDDCQHPATFAAAHVQDQVLFFTDPVPAPQSLPANESKHFNLAV